jgi:hypothetical protein
MSFNHLRIAYGQRRSFRDAEIFSNRDPLYGDPNLCPAPSDSGCAASDARSLTAAPVLLGRLNWAQSELHWGTIFLHLAPAKD